MEKVITILENRPYIAKLGRNQFPKVYKEVKLDNTYSAIFSISETWIERSKKRAFTRHNKGEWDINYITLNIYITFIKDNIKYLYRPWIVSHVEDIDELIKKITSEKFVKSIDNIITDIFADTNVVEYC